MRTEEEPVDTSIGNGREEPARAHEAVQFLHPELSARAACTSNYSLCPILPAVLVLTPVRR